MTFIWNHIEDLPSNWKNLLNKEIGALSNIWREQNKRLVGTTERNRFNEKLKRKWAIETGIIEHLYDIDRGTTELLIERGINESLIQHGSTDRPAEEIVPILRDQEEALDWLFDFVSNKRDLSISFIKELHQLLTRHQEFTKGRDQSGRYIKTKLSRGVFKQWPNNPQRSDGTIFEYCPPIQVQSEMDNLIEFHLKHIKNSVTPEVEAAWLHHRFTQIHPFQDANGRIARCLASLVLIRAEWFPLVVHREQREDYILALEEADKGNLQPLIKLFVDIQKKALIEAISLSEDILSHERNIKEIVSSAADKLKSRSLKEEEKYYKSLEFANKLKKIAFERLSEVSESISEQIRPINSGYFSTVGQSDANNNYYFREQIIQTANDMNGYYANTRWYREWIRMHIKEERQTNFVVSFHSLGFEFSGILVASAFIFQKETDEEGEKKNVNFSAACREIFQFNYREKFEDIRKRFNEWLNDSILIALDKWRKEI